MIDRLLLNEIEPLAYSAIFIGSMLASLEWFNKMYARRSGMHYQLALNGLDDILPN